MFMKRKIRKGTSLLLAALMVLGMFGAVGFGVIGAAAAAWNGTNFGGGTVYGDKTFLQAFGINYNQYMHWLDTHDADSSNPRYYLGTPYVGYVAANGTEDHRVPNGDSWYNLPSYNRGAYPPSGHGMQCTGFVWHVLYKSQAASGNGSRLNEIPTLSNNVSTWVQRGIYRVCFTGTNAISQALESGVLEKGDIIWIEGSDDWHTGIFYGSTATDNKFWNSAPDSGTNEISRIKGCGTVYNVYILKVTQPDNVELKVTLTPSSASLKTNSNYSLFGAKYCIFTSFADARAAALTPTTDAAWNKRIGTMVTNRDGNGAFRTGTVPTAAELGTLSSSPNYNHEYFSRACVRSDAKITYYAVQWSASKGYQLNRNIYQFGDKGTDNKLHRSNTGWRYMYIRPLASPAPATTTPTMATLPSEIVTLPTEPVTMPTEIVTEPTEEPIITEPTTQEPTESATEPTTEPPTEPVTEPPEPATITTEPVTEPTEEPVTTEPTTQEPTEPTEPPTEPPTVPAPIEPEYKLGDVNFDNEVNVADATAIQKYLAGLLELDGDALRNADFNGDGVVDVADATAIQKFAAGIQADEPDSPGEPATPDEPASLAYVPVDAQNHEKTT